MPYVSEYLNKIAAISPLYASLIESDILAGMTEAEAEQDISRYIGMLPAEVQKSIADQLNTLKQVAETGVWLTLEQFKTQFPEMFAEPEKPPEEDEISKVMLGRYINASITTIASATIQAGAFAAGFLPTMTVSWGIMGMLNIPPLSSSISIANDILSAEHFIAFRPMMQRYYLRQRTPLIPEAYRLVEFRTAGKISPETYKAAMAENGLNGDWADAYELSSYTGLPIEVGLAVVRRGLLTENNFKENMKYLKFHPNDIEHILALKDVIPPLNDLITFAVKEGFGRHTSEEQYPSLVEWAGKMGLNEGWAEAYWYSHWDRISLTQMYDNLYRGLWDKDRFMSMLRIKDVHPDDREAIFNVAYQVPGVRELGYGYDVGAYSREDIARFRRYAGLSPVDAEKAADSLILYRNEAEKNAVLNEWMYLYSLGKITKDDFIAKLKGKGIPDPTIELWVERAEAHSIRISKPTALEEGRIPSSSEGIYAFKNGIIGEDYLLKILKDLDWTDERIGIAIARAKLEIEQAKPVIKPVEKKLTSTSTIEAMYKLNMRNRTDTILLLRSLDYAERDLNFFVELWDMEKAIDERPKALTITDYKNFFDAGVIDKAGLQKGYVSVGYSEADASLLAMWAAVSIRFGDLVTLYKNGWKTAKQVYDELIAIGLPVARADELMQTIIKYQQPTRVTAEKDLTKAEIIKGWKNGILDNGQAIGLLMDLGYDENEAYYLLQINAVVAAGDPESYWEMKKVTEAYKKALGQPSKPVPDDLLIWEQRYKQLKKELDDLRAKNVSDEEISAKVIQLADVEANYRRMIMEWEKPSA